MHDSSDPVSAVDQNPPPPTPCANCGSPLSGHFCAICGQPNREIKRPVYSLLREFFHILLDLDGRAYRSVGLLLTRPAFLSNVYVSGQRMRYTPPLRLFVAISILFFVVVTVGSSMVSLRDAMNSVQEPDSTATAITDQATGNTANSVAAGTDQSSTASDISDELDEEDLEGIFSLIELIHLPLLSDANNTNLQAVMRQQAEANYANLLADPAGTLMGLLEYITVFMLAMMPLMALVQKLFFITSCRYYIEHLVLVLHNNAFVIAMLLLQTLLDAVTSAEIAFISGLTSLISDVAAIWMPIYLLLSLKFFFHRGWLLTSLMFLLITLAYIAITASGVALLAITLFLLF